MRKLLLAALLLGAALMPPAGLLPGVSPGPVFAGTEKQAAEDLKMIIEERDVLKKIEQEQFAEARQILPAQIKEARKEGKENTAALQLLALLDYREHHYGRALKNLLKVERYHNRKGAPKDPASRKALVNYRIADCYYKNRDFKKAEKRYEKALAFAQESNGAAELQMELLEAISACLADAGKYKEALPYAAKLLEMARAQSTNSNPAYKSNYMWALFRISKIHKQTGDQKAGEAARSEGLKILNSLIEKSSDLAEQSTLTQNLYAGATMLIEYLKPIHPETSTDWLWIFSQVKLKTLPVIAWGQGNTVPKASLICIHGLGLDNRAFAVFGKEMAERGYAVYALDVRGFGSWLEEKGYENTVYSATINDIVTLSGILAKKHSGVPVYLLGESMGGSIALRAASEQADSIDGIISAVPSAEVAKPLKISLKVALHALDGFDKPFNFGETIAPMATNRKELISAWEIDTKAKTRMSPKELMKYGLYLKKTRHYCGKIQKTPVLMTQGLSDRLMSPHGTVALFDAIPNKDKAIIAIGDGQHLLFESDHQSKFLLDALVAWMEHHKAVVRAR